MENNYKSSFIKISCLIFFFSSFVMQAQITPFTMTLTPTDETCTGNGEITIDITGSQNGSDFEFVIYQLPNTTTPFRVTSGIMPTGPDFTILQHTETSFPAGNYRIVATQTVGVQTNQQTEDTTVNNNIQSLEYTATESFICGSSEITVNVTAGNPATYELRDTSNGVVIPPQASNVLSPVAAGSYLVVVTDVCGNSVTQGITASAPVVTYGFRRNNGTAGFNTLQDCNNFLHTEDISYNGDNNLPAYVFPIQVLI